MIFKNNAYLCTVETNRQDVNKLKMELYGLLLHSMQDYRKW